MTLVYRATPGWNADARTVESFSNDGIFTFKVANSIGVVCGLNSTNNNANYLEIDHAFLIDPRNYKIIERGVTVKSESPIIAGATYGIERLGEIIRYFINDDLVYTSTLPSSGTVFGDCSLYAYLDTITDTCILDYDSETIVTEAIGTALLGPVLAVGLQGAINFGLVGIGPVSSAGTEDDINRGSIAIGPVGSLGAEGDPNWRAVLLGPLSVSGQEDVLLPDYNAGSAYLGPTITYGYEGIIDVCNGTAALGPLIAAGGEGNVAFGGAEIGPLLAGGYSTYRQYLLAEWPAWLLDNRQLLFNAACELIIPAPILTAEGHNYDNAHIRVIIPAPILAAFTGAVARLSVPSPVLTSTGTVKAVARAELEVPAPILTATATNSIMSSALLNIPAPVLTAFTGAYAVLEIPAPILTTSGSVGHLAWAELTLPAPTLTASAKVGTLATVELEIPAPILTATGIIGAIARVVLIVPAPILTATGRVSPGVGIAASSLATETTYAVNLTTGAVTTLLLGELTKLVTAHGRLYGLRSGELVKLNGDLDGVTTIPAVIRFAPQNFGSNLTKRINAVYLSSRENNGLTLDLIEDETIAWRYQTNTDTAPAYGTHRIKVGRGVKFHTAGIALYNRNGGRMDVGGMELIVDIATRRPKS